MLNWEVQFRKKYRDLLTPDQVVNLIYEERKKAKIEVLEIVEDMMCNHPDNQEFVEELRRQTVGDDLDFYRYDLI